MAPDPAEQIALFRYRVIAEVLSDRLSPAERGLLVRELAARAHELPDGSRKEFSRATLDRWIRAYRESELAGLYPQLRSDWGAVRKQPELLEEAALLRREAPARSAEQISRILLAVPPGPADNLGDAREAEPHAARGLRDPGWRRRELAGLP